jgi:hypothetical protein
MTGNLKIVAAAALAMVRRGYESRPGFCARFVRQVVWEVYNRRDFPPGNLDARQQFQWFAAQGLSIPLEHGSVPGDLLYKISFHDGLHGHVGIRCIGNVVIENSSYHSENGSDARGQRTLEAFGEVSGIIRLPPTPRAPGL